MSNLFVDKEKMPVYVYVSEFINHWLSCISGICIYRLWVPTLK